MTTFNAGGLASGLDTNKIVDSLVALESRTITMNQARQGAVQAQISAVGDVVSKLQSLVATASTLGTSGALALTASTGHSGFLATSTAAAAAGSYAISVDSLATAAKARSQMFNSAVSQVVGGTLHLTVQGVTHDLTVDDGASLSQVADSINALGAPVSATVLVGKTGAYLSLTNRDTGFTVGGNAGDALAITQDITGSTGQALNLAVTQTAANAAFTVDGLEFERSSNDVSDAIPGVTLQLKAHTSTAETLSLARDVDQTAANIGRFVDGYNTLSRLLAKSLAVTQQTNRDTTLAGSPAARSLQVRLQSLVASNVAGAGSDVGSLAALGVKTNRDGTLALDTAALAKAMARSPQAVNQVFGDAANGKAAQLKALSQTFTAASGGLLTSMDTQLHKRLDELSLNGDRLQLRVDQYRQTLIKQFTAMEKVVSGLKGVSDFLTNQKSS